jgi:hypothetical protein
MFMFSHHHKSSAVVQATAQELFSLVDDPVRLSSHMSESSWMMGGSRMRTEVDSGGGKAIGSHIRMDGRVFGVQLALDEAITERDPPRHKVWETIGQPRLLVIGHYKMGFDITSQGGGSLFCVFIDYTLPESAPARWLGWLFARHYARWCTQRMVDDAVKHFSASDHD